MGISRAEVLETVRGAKQTIIALAFMQIQAYRRGLTIASTGAREASLLSFLECSARARLRWALDPSDGEVKN